MGMFRVQAVLVGWTRDDGIDIPILPRAELAVGTAAMTRMNASIRHQLNLLIACSGHIATAIAMYGCVLTLTLIDCLTSSIARGRDNQISVSLHHHLLARGRITCVRCGMTTHTCPHRVMADWDDR